jgi:hypothetical protein
VTNTLANYHQQLGTKETSLITCTVFVDVMKTFYLSLTKELNEVECLSVGSGKWHGVK